MTEPCSLVPVAYVIFVREVDGRDQVLLQLREGTGYRDGHWGTAAGGHVEHGESVVAAAVRETEEELGLTRVEVTPLCAMHRTDGTGDLAGQRADFFFLATAWTGEARIAEPDRCADLRWFDLDALPEPMVPHERRVFEGLRDGTLQPILLEGF